MICTEGWLAFREMLFARCVVDMTPSISLPE
jgi:hypothetical protein